MRKKAFLILAVVMIVAITSVALIACGEETTTTANPVHKISAVAGENYEIKNLASSAQVGDPVYFDVEVTNSFFYSVESVWANDIVCVDEGFGYKFTMPDEDVVITVILAPVGEYNDPDDKLDWGSTLVDTIPYGLTGQFDLPLSMEISSANWITSIQATIESSDQTVIPSDAIEFIPKKASTSNAIEGGKLSIDLSKVNPGKTYIYVYLKSGNTSTVFGTLIKEFTVSDNSEVEVEMMDVVLNVKNNSGYDSEYIFINLTDQNYIPGSDYSDRQTVYVKDAVDSKITFSYAVGHTYLITVGFASEYNDLGQAQDLVNLSLLEWTGSNVGGAVNQIKNYSNRSAYLLTLTTAGIEATLDIRK